MKDLDLSYEEVRYCPTSATDGTTNIRIATDFISTGEHRTSTPQKEREQILLNKVDKAIAKRYQAERKCSNLQAQLTQNQCQTENRNEAIAEVVGLVSKTITITGNTYDNIVKKINNVKGSYTLESIAEAIIKERSIEVMKLSRSKRRLTLSS